MKSSNPGAVAMSLRHLLSLTAALIYAPTLAHSADNSFFGSLGGSWKGSGIVLTRIGSSPINVNCNFTIDGEALTLSMDGTCRGMVVVKRSISAKLRASGQSYTGTYTGPSGQPSTLSGSRQGNTINLGVRWARVINGDRVANLMLEKIGNNRLRLQTIDKDLETGKSVVTSRVDLSR
jgi:hypothetical protein